LPYYKYLFIMELRFHAMLYSILGNENSDVGHTKCSVGRKFPTPGLQSLASQERAFHEQGHDVI